MKAHLFTNKSALIRSEAKIKDLFPIDYSKIIEMPCDSFFDKLWFYAYDLPGYHKCKNPSCDTEIKQRILEARYCGVECRSNDPSFRKKVDETMMANGGYGTSRQSTKDKIKATNLQRYGVENSFDIDRKGNTEKAKATRLEKTGCEWHQQANLKNLDDLKNTEFVEGLIKTGWRAIADHFGLSTATHSSAIKFIRSHGFEYRQHGNSGTELEILDYVRSLGVEASSDRKMISPKELDVYVPSRNLAIEHNGLYWHSAWSKEQESELKNYHVMKTNDCAYKGISLLHIFENEWLYKQDIWKSVIKVKLGLADRLYARKCRVEEISVKSANEFCLENHLQGSCVASKAYGLYYDDILVQVITLGRPRYNKKYDYEIIRIASKLNTVVVGGVSKLLKYCPKGSYISYANRRWSNGNVYRKSGFKQIDISGPCYWIVDGKTLHHRSAFMKHKLKDKLDHFDETKTEAENCYDNGLGRIWDCGNVSYELIIN